MTMRSTAALGVRLLAIYWGVRSLDAWGQLLTLFVPGLPWDQVNFGSIATATLIPGLVQSGIALSLWLAAGPISSAIVRAAGSDAREAPQARAKEGWPAAAISVAGIVIAASALPGLAGAVYQNRAAPRARIRS